METLLLAQGKHQEYERQRQITLDAEAEWMEAESAVQQCRTRGPIGNRPQVDNPPYTTTTGGS